MLRHAASTDVGATSFWIPETSGHTSSKLLVANSSNRRGFLPTGFNASWPSDGVMSFDSAWPLSLLTSSLLMSGSASSPHTCLGVPLGCLGVLVVDLLQGFVGSLDALLKLDEVVLVFLDGLLDFVRRRLVQQRSSVRRRDQ